MTAVNGNAAKQAAWTVAAGVVVVLIVGAFTWWRDSVADGALSKHRLTAVGRSVAILDRRVSRLERAIPGHVYGDMP